jgi:hypothetical protein
LAKALHPVLEALRADDGWPALSVDRGFQQKLNEVRSDVEIADNEEPLMGFAELGTMVLEFVL